MDNYQQVIAASRYARWLDKEQRRETWDEVVNRFCDYVYNDVAGTLTEEEFFKLGAQYLPDKIYPAVRDLEVMPSMRALMTAGPALARCNVAGYNCAYLPVDSLRSFDEAMYILMCGTGVGFSVERTNVEKLPVVNEHFERTSTTIKVADSKAGWARSFKELISLLASGQIPEWDMSGVRQAGERLKTFGGRASGPEPLHDLFKFSVNLFTGAAGRKLKPIECHDLMCKVGEVVVVGGVRRSALISLSDLDDHEMAHAKAGQWWENYPHRALANNSAVYKGDESVGQFLGEWTSIYESKSGERGIFNRGAVVEQVKRTGRRRTENIAFGTNPCSEIILRPYQFCNLTEVVVRSNDSSADLRRKIDIAVFLGTVQSRWTDFKYLRKIWRDNCEEERLLGVSLTGIFDSPDSLTPEVLRELRDYAVDRNKYYANLFGINQSVAVTCVKPSGTVSQLVDSASGLHPRHSKFYRRTIRGDNKDPMTDFLKDMGVEAEPDVMKPKDTTVFSFYVKAPEGALTRDDLTAKEHLDWWLRLQNDWCEHKPSVTINVREKEWPSLGGAVWDCFDQMTGVAFLPYSEHTYQQAPYQEITKEEYDKRPIYDIDWSKLSDYEKEDTTAGSQELACTGNQCEWTDIGT
jgi:ribonucleoside-diphosphate reductase alpha chain